MRQEKT